MTDSSPRDPIPIEIKLHQQSRCLEVHFDDGAKFEFTCEFLRVHSPSAEVRGHGGHDSVLQTGKEGVQITAIEPVGNYAVKLIFDDGHSTGLYSWGTFYDLGAHYDEYWQTYLSALKAAGYQRNESY